MWFNGAYPYLSKRSLVLANIRRLSVKFQQTVLFFWLNDIDLQRIALKICSYAQLFVLKKYRTRKTKELCQFVLRTVHPFARSSKSFSFHV